MAYDRDIGLLMLGNDVVAENNFVFPLGYIQLDTYSIKRNTLYKNSYTDADGFTQAEALSHQVDKIKFKTIPMTNIEWDVLMRNIEEKYADNDSKPSMSKKSKSFWCSYYVPEKADYERFVGCHLTDIEISINRIDQNTGIVYYNPITLTITVW